MLIPSIDEVVEMVRRRRAIEAANFDYYAHTDLLPCGERSIYLPYSARSSNNSIEVGTGEYMHIDDFLAAIPGLIVVWRRGPAHGWRCWARQGTEQWEANYHPLRYKPDTPIWAKEALEQYFS